MPEDRQIAIDLIDEAVTGGARCFKACMVLEVDVRTLQRWRKAAVFVSKDVASIDHAALDS